MGVGSAAQRHRRPGREPPLAAAIVAGAQARGVTLSRPRGVRRGRSRASTPIQAAGSAAAEAHFFPPEVWVRRPAEWLPRTQTGGSYDLTGGKGLRVCSSASSARSPAPPTIAGGARRRRTPTAAARQRMSGAGPLPRPDHPTPQARRSESGQTRRPAQASRRDEGASLPPSLASRTYRTARGSHGTAGLRALLDGSRR